MIDVQHVCSALFYSAGNQHLHTTGAVAHAACLSRAQVSRGSDGVVRGHRSEGQVPGHETREVVHPVMVGLAIPLAEVRQSAPLFRDAGGSSQSERDRSI